jgi:thiamine kinase-like enzyme
MSRYPGTRALSRRLASTLVAGRPAGTGVSILDRKRQERESTFPSEVVTFRTNDGREAVMWCKYSSGRGRSEPAWHHAHGHRGGLTYEASIYRHVLEPLHLSTVRLLGASESQRGAAWIAIEYLDDALPIKSVPDAITNAAEWIGRFHARNETRVTAASLQFLTRYTADYYRGWADRTLEFARRHLRDCRHVEQVCAAFDPASADLLAAPLTIIHGEFYPSNVLWHRSVVYPVDWETAAIGAGEIDLVCLTEHWPASVKVASEAAYMRARWPQGHEWPAFQRRLKAATLYMLLRWTGTVEAWSSDEARGHYVGRLDEEARRLSGDGAESMTPLAVSRAR